MTDEQKLDILSRSCKLMIEHLDWSWQRSINNAILDYREEHDENQES